MQHPRTLLCLSLILCGLVSQSLGLTFSGKDKRGWTLNSAGYLLGPHVSFRAHLSLFPKGRASVRRGRGFEPLSLPRALLTDSSSDAHRTLNDKGGLAGKRDAVEESYKKAEDVYTPNVQPIDETVLDFMSYLRLKELGALDNLIVSEDST
ncbi:galanin peptides-like isoform X1 [Acipenser ruthenus]|uniref:galanin peptides-like isoform X1 n=1 Tax=Acipenser ruthenus TaxID=7906 RepID=UPI002740B47B|nr:galanin peptides-like isoform X1 [Acipenser ruthenus]XP_058874144.1 galanin peptides-like isoform X1 [Acipenser ruthenus]